MQRTARPKYHLYVMRSSTTALGTAEYCLLYEEQTALLLSYKTYMHYRMYINLINLFCEILFLMNEIKKGLRAV